MGHMVVGLRDVKVPGYAADGQRWMRLEDAEAADVDFNGYEAAIGPRRRGVVYLGGYWKNVSTVHDVFVCVTQARGAGGRFVGCKVVGWTVVEEDASDCGRVRSHMTSWEYDRYNQALFTIG